MVLSPSAIAFARILCYTCSCHVIPFEATGELCDRKTLLSNFPLLDKDGNVVMDDARGKPKCKDEGRANNDLKKFFKEVSTLYEADAL